MAEEQASAATVLTPIVIDLGKKRRKRIRALKKGYGELMDEVGDIVQEVSAGLAESGDGKQVVPIVMIYRRKRKKQKGGFNLFPFLG